MASRDLPLSNYQCSRVNEVNIHSHLFTGLLYKHVCVYNIPGLLVIDGVTKASIDIVFFSLFFFFSFLVSGKKKNYM